MRAVIALLAMGSATMLVASRAHAEDGHFELGGGAGYHGAWTTGVDPYRMGVALGGGRSFRGGLYLGVRVSQHFGEIAAGAGPRTMYFAHDRATRFDAIGGFSLPLIPWLVLRPGAIVGVDWITGRTQIGGVRLADDRLVPSFGPYLRLAWQGRGLFVGVEGDGRFVPGQPAAPRAGASVIWGARF